MNCTNIFFSSLVHLLYPSVCEGCGTDIPGGRQLLCIDCIDELPFTNFSMQADNPVEKIFWGRLPIENAMALIYFSKKSIIQTLLHQFKYRGNKEIGLYFGRKMGEALMESKRFMDVDALIPLPLFRMKEKKRGYNQASILCEGMNEVMGITLLKDVIIRKNNTQTQTHKSRTARWNNIEGKFELINPLMIRKKHILLVDDVITTGATLEACGSELLKARDVRISIGSLAYTAI